MSFAATGRSDIQMCMRRVQLFKRVCQINMEENRVTGRNRIRVSEVNVGSFRFEAGRLREYTANGIGSGSGRVD